ncbi:MAG TPA: SAM-dependent methyltransferase [Casimicrobiaceae bacterium]|nr:SAM-dependent methyltransferase [Casimicrobiaceae bacterium]
MIDTRLPTPDADARAQSARVVAHVRDELERGGGFMPFTRYMEIVLYAPALGYYVAGARKFGAAGDFVTGPELTPLYGAAIARQLAPVLAATRGRQIVELGAGSGALAASVLNALAACGAASSHYRILEVSPPLRALQRATIERHAPSEVVRVEWLDRLPAAIDGAVVMNEVLDAIAPRLLARKGGQWLERGVVWNDDALAWGERPLDDARARAIAEARFPREGDYASEVNPAAEALVTTLAQRIASGALLIIDYGFPQHEYYHPQRSEGTLVGHYRHRVHADPFLWPGLSDLTSHVDFTAIANAAERGGLRVAGFATQASFLLGCGILDRLRDVGAPETASYLRATAAVQQLLSPAEMGELFKVLLLARGDVGWRSLALTDMTHRL